MKKKKEKEENLVEWSPAFRSACLMTKLSSTDTGGLRYRLDTCLIPSLFGSKM
jgi:hypothetical protein